MKSRIHGMFLSLFFALALCFSFSTEASAHDYARSDGGKTYTHTETFIEAGDITDPASEADIKQLLLHLVEHLNQIQGDTDLDQESGQEIAKEAVIFLKTVRDNAVFHNKDSAIYTMGITRRGAVVNHPLYQHLYGSRYYDENNPAEAPLAALIVAGNIKDSTTAAPVEPVCATYTDHNDQSRVACGIKQDTTTGEVTSIAGFHHAEDALMTPDCNEFTLDVTAKQVEEATDPDIKKDLLKQYVQDVITTSQELLNTEATAVQMDPAVPAAVKLDLAAFSFEVFGRIYEKTICFGKDGQRDNGENDFFHESIYPFIMDPLRGTSLVNGLDFNLHGLSVSLVDPNPIPNTIAGEAVTEANVLELFQKALTDGTGVVPGDLAHGKTAFVKYHWDDPTTEDDNVRDFLERNPTEVPGNSIKESYLEVVNIYEGQTIPGTEIPVPAAYFVFGSGIYMDDSGSMPPGMAAADDDGCSIAATGSTHQSALLNLLLVASVLFSAVFLRKRG